MGDLISRQAAIDTLETVGYDFSNSELSETELAEVCEAVGDVRQDMINRISKIPSAQPEPCDDPRADVYYLAEKIGIHRLYALVVELRGEPEPCEDAVSRQAAIDAIGEKADEIYKTKQKGETYPHDDFFQGMAYAENIVKQLPSAQPEQRCVNCGRTANNGGWYEDGGTRCPIEEHYALPKDGYCHLWEKRKVWEDDYVKRPEEGGE